MVTYVDAVHPVARIYDGFLIHSRGGGGAPLVDSPSILGEGVARIRDDLDVPVLQFLTETDLFGVLGFHRARQDDSDTLRTWEVAGTAHADRSILDYNAEMAQEVAGGGFDLVAECGSINEGSQAQVLRAAIAGLRAWVVDGDPPPTAPPLEVEGQAIARDERGIALGGIRTPAVDAPVSVLTGEAPPGRSVLCLLFGDTRPFDAATLAALYPTHQDYVDAVTGSADAAVAAGFLRQAEADDIVAAAEDADVPS
jgi:Alpha/beta hydrolase domain